MFVGALNATELLQPHDQRLDDRPADAERLRRGRRARRQCSPAAMCCWPVLRRHPDNQAHYTFPNQQSSSNSTHERTYLDVYAARC
jgi:hypothetical protein